jgi:hypothetical protein
MNKENEFLPLEIRFIVIFIVMGIFPSVVLYKMTNSIYSGLVAVVVLVLMLISMKMFESVTPNLKKSK